MYKIEEMIKSFKEHALQNQMNREELREAFKKSLQPGEEMPEYMKDEFSIARALFHICMEIKQIKTCLGIEPAEDLDDSK